MLKPGEDNRIRVANASLNEYLSRNLYVKSSSRNRKIVQMKRGVSTSKAEGARTKSNLGMALMGTIGVEGRELKRCR